MTFSIFPSPLEERGFEFGSRMDFSNRSPFMVVNKLKALFIIADPVSKSK
jgi:hypothetical protein